MVTIIVQNCCHSLRGLCGLKFCSKKFLHYPYQSQPARSVRMFRIFNVFLPQPAIPYVNQNHPRPMHSSTTHPLNSNYNPKYQPTIYKTSIDQQLRYAGFSRPDGDFSQQYRIISISHIRKSNRHLLCNRVY